MEQRAAPSVADPLYQDDVQEEEEENEEDDDDDDDDDEECPQPPSASPHIQDSFH